VSEGELFRVETVDWTGGQISDDDCADDIKYVDLSQVGVCVKSCACVSWLSRKPPHWHTKLRAVAARKYCICLDVQLLVCLLQSMDLSSAAPACRLALSVRSLTTEAA
jgi:hypothetical protein